MISFITTNDEITSSCHQVYKALDLKESSALIGADATREKLTQEIRDPRSLIFAMSHGNESALMGQDGMAAIDSGNIKEFANYTIFAFACNTSRMLGRTASLNGVNWVGFIDRINAPEEYYGLKPIYKVLFEFIAGNLSKIACAVTASDFLEKLKTLCDSALNEAYDYVEKTDEDSTDIMSIAISIRQLWQLQSIWISGSHNSIKHPEAPEPILRW